MMDMPEKPEQVHMPHDTGYRYLLGSKKTFLQLIRSFTAQGWADQVDEAGLELINRSFVLQDFKDKEADIVYRAKLKDRDVIFFVLLELQSTVDFLLPYRLLLYMNEIWRTIFKNTPGIEAARKDFCLPAIIPIVLYNGKAAWTAPLSFKETLDGYKLFGEHIVDFRYFLINVHNYTEEELLELSNLFSVVFMLERVEKLEEIVDCFYKMISVIKKLNPEEFKLLKSWSKFILARDLPKEGKEELVRILDESRTEEVEKMISNVERVIKKSIDDAMEKGMEKGMEQGIVKVARQMLADQEKLEKIIKYTGLSREEIENLKQ